MDELNVGQNCNQKQLNKGCTQVPPIMPFRMHTFNGKMICGKKGGDPFITVTRPNPLTSQCPAGYVACSTKTTPNNTICYNSALDPTDVCPITQFEFISELGDCSDPSAEWIDFEGGVTLCFSKQVNSLPVTKIRVENLPCADPNYQIQLVSDATELQKAKKCPVEPNSSLSVSPLYKMVGSNWRTTEYDIEMQNYIGDALGLGTNEDSFMFLSASQSLYVDIQYQQSIKPWSRPIFPWSLSCEKDGFTRQQAYTDVYNQTFNSVSIVWGLDVQPITISVIVLNSIFFFLMLAYFTDPQDSACVQRFCTPAKPVVAAMILMRLVILVAIPITLNNLAQMNVRFKEFKQVTSAVLSAQKACSDSSVMLGEQFLTDSVTNIQKSLVFSLAAGCIAVGTIVIEIVMTIIVSCVCKQCFAAHVAEINEPAAEHKTKEDHP